LTVPKFRERLTKMRCQRFNFVLVAFSTDGMDDMQRAPFDLTRSRLTLTRS
jgi:hypothetical protein